MTDSQKLIKLRQSFPKRFNVENNPVWKALLAGIAGSDDDIATQLNNTKAQLFVRTAEGIYLSRLASSLGVARDINLGLPDTDFQELIPNLSLKAKQIRKTFYDTMDVFWGPLFSRANVTASNAAPYNISTGDEFKIKIDGGSTQTIRVLSGEVSVGGSATISELISILSRCSGLIVSEQEDVATSSSYINLRTNSPGLRGSVEIVSSSGFGSSKIDIDSQKYELGQQTQRTVIYEIRPNELIIEIPASVPSLQTNLDWTHHFHATSALESPIPPSNGIWEGCFFYNQPNTTSGITVTSQRAKIQEILSKGNVYTKVTVDDTTGFSSTSGNLVFGWGTDSEESVVRYRGIPNSNTILLDPSYVFQNDQPINTYVNVVSEEAAPQPNINGQDHAIFLLSPSSIRALVQDLLETLAAAGVVLNFVILAPEYRYMIDNPYISTDDAPSS